MCWHWTHVCIIPCQCLKAARFALKYFITREYYLWMDLTLLFHGILRHFVLKQICYSSLYNHSLSPSPGTLCVGSRTSYDLDLTLRVLVIIWHAISRQLPVRQINLLAASGPDPPTTSMLWKGWGILIQCAMLLWWPLWGLLDWYTLTLLKSLQYI